MLTIDPQTSLLLVIDFQSRLMPAINQANAAIANANRLLETAQLLDIPRLFTEQNAKGLGPTVDTIPVEPGRLLHKLYFDACREDGFLAKIPEDAAIVVAGCEAHVCVQQTVLGLLDAGRKVHLVRDALGSRRPEDKETAICRMARHGADIVTTEMVVFEWLATSDHPAFRKVISLVK